jgi:DNA-binding sugar fermentation-stimulating protein
VSARAIKHVQELTKLVTEEREDGSKYCATVLFVVIRHDAKAFRPNHEACPSFAKYLKKAQDSGVQILAKQVRWGEGDDVGKCYEGDLLKTTWPKDE